MSELIAPSVRAWARPARMARASSARIAKSDATVRATPTKLEAPPRWPEAAAGGGRRRSAARRRRRTPRASPRRAAAALGILGGTVAARRTARRRPRADAARARSRGPDRTGVLSEHAGRRGGGMQRASLSTGLRSTPAKGSTRRSRGSRARRRRRSAQAGEAAVRVRRGGRVARRRARCGAARPAAQARARDLREAEQALARARDARSRAAAERATRHCSTRRRVEAPALRLHRRRSTRWRSIDVARRVARSRRLQSMLGKDRRHRPPPRAAAAVGRQGRAVAPRTPQTPASSRSRPRPAVDAGRRSPTPPPHKIEGATDALASLLTRHRSPAAADVRTQRAAVDADDGGAADAGAVDAAPSRLDDAGAAVDGAAERLQEWRGGRTDRCRRRHRLGDAGRQAGALRRDAPAPRAVPRRIAVPSFAAEGAGFRRSTPPRRRPGGSGGASRSARWPRSTRGRRRRRPAAGGGGRCSPPRPPAGRASSPRRRHRRRRCAPGRRCRLAPLAGARAGADARGVHGHRGDALRRRRGDASVAGDRGGDGESRRGNAGGGAAALLDSFGRGGAAAAAPAAIGGFRVAACWPRRAPVCLERRHAPGAASGANDAPRPSAGRRGGGGGGGGARLARDLRAAAPPRRIGDERPRRRRRGRRSRRRTAPASSASRASRATGRRETDATTEAEVRPEFEARPGGAEPRRRPASKGWLVGARRGSARSISSDGRGSPSAPVAAREGRAHARRRVAAGGERYRARRSAVAGPPAHRHRSDKAAAAAADERTADVVADECGRAAASLAPQRGGAASAGPRQDSGARCKRARAGCRSRGGTTRRAATALEPPCPPRARAASSRSCGRAAARRAPPATAIATRARASSAHEWKNVPSVEKGGDSEMPRGASLASGVARRSLARWRTGRFRAGASRRSRPRGPRRPVRGPRRTRGRRRRRARAPKTAEKGSRMRAVESWRTARPPRSRAATTRAAGAPPRGRVSPARRQAAAARQRCTNAGCDYVTDIRDDFRAHERRVRLRDRRLTDCGEKNLRRCDLAEHEANVASIRRGARAVRGWVVRSRAGRGSSTDAFCAAAVPCCRDRLRRGGCGSLDRQISNRRALAAAAVRGSRRLGRPLLAPLRTDRIDQAGARRVPVHGHRIASSTCSRRAPTRGLDIRIARLEACSPSASRGLRRAVRPRVEMPSATAARAARGHVDRRRTECATSRSKAGRAGISGRSASAPRASRSPEADRQSLLRGTRDARAPTRRAARAEGRRSAARACGGRAVRASRSDGAARRAARARAGLRARADDARALVRLSLRAAVGDAATRGADVAPPASPSRRDGRVDRCPRAS